MTKEKREEYTETTTVGKYTSVITRMRVADIDIDNYSLSKIYQDGKLIETIDNRRHLPPRILPPVENAESNEFGRMMLIDHKNPVWILDKKINRDITCQIIRTDDGIALLDIVESKIIGTGLPPLEKKAMAVTGEHMDGETHEWFSSLRAFVTQHFERWGCNTWSAYRPSLAEYEAHIKDSTCKYNFLCGHGAPNGITLILTGPDVSVSASNIETWLADRDKMTFTFLYGCHCMADTSSGTLSYAFRKGSMTDTVVIGFKGLTLDGSCNGMMFQTAVFDKANTGVTLKDAFDYALALNPGCIGNAVFEGDTTLRVVSDPSLLPLLSIEDVWVENCKIHYRIKNEGDPAGASHTRVKVNTVIKATKVEAPLASGQSREGVFSDYTWAYQGIRTSIWVIPDCNEELAGTHKGKSKNFLCGSVTGGIEMNYTDVYKIHRRAADPNYHLEIPWAADVTGNGIVDGLDGYYAYYYHKYGGTLHCPCGAQCEGIDLVIGAITNYNGKVRITIKNKGTVDSPAVRPGFAFRIGMTWYLKGYWLIDPITAGSTTTYTSNIDWPSAGTKIQAFPDKYFSYTDCNPTNNNLTITV